MKARHLVLCSDSICFKDKGKRVVITEGELDAASCYQVMPGWQMVSLPSGAASAKKSIQKALEWLQGYDEVCLFFDNDDAGYKATQEAASVLPPGKVTIANLNQDYKDASDALMAKMQKPSAKLFGMLNLTDLMVS